MNQFEKAEKYLNTLLIFGIKLGLDNVKNLLALLGNPDQNLKFIHIAGTNGKGSTSVMLSSALSGSGLKTGLFTSPFLVHLTERWRIDGTPIDLETLGSIILEIAELEDRLVEMGGAKPTYFEILTVAGIVWFAREKTDIVILETGMGGRLDATNVVDPLLTVITNVSLDHMEYLGETIEEIAREKAGIIKPGKRLITGEMDSQALDVILTQAAELEAPVSSSLEVILKGSENVFKNGYFSKQVLRYEFNENDISVEINLAGSHQRKNTALVIRVLHELAQSGIIQDFDHAVAKISNALWPARMQHLKQGVIIDGAHNPDAAHNLAHGLEELYGGGKKWTFVFGVLKDKDWKSMLDMLIPYAKEWIVCPVSMERSEDPEEIMEYLSINNQTVTKSITSDLEIEKDTVVFGSLYFAGEVLTLLDGEGPVKISAS